MGEDKKEVENGRMSNGSVSSVPRRQQSALRRGVRVAQAGVLGSNSDHPAEPKPDIYYTRMDITPQIIYLSQGKTLRTQNILGAAFQEYQRSWNKRCLRGQNSHRIAKDRRLGS